MEPLMPEREVPANLLTERTHGNSGNLTIHMHKRMVSRGLIRMHPAAPPYPTATQLRHDRISAANHLKHSDLP